MTAFLLCNHQECSAEAHRVAAKVIEAIPTATSYDWTVDGRSSTHCYSSGCASHFSPPNAGTATVRGAELKLLLADGSIVVAGCSAKYDIAGNLMAALTDAMTDASSSAIYRDCRGPAVDTVIEAEFRRATVKLFIQEPSIDGRGAKYSETYRIMGVLNPANATAPRNSSDARSIGMASLAEGDIFMGQFEYTKAFNKYVDAKLAGDRGARGEAEFRIAEMSVHGQGVLQDPEVSDKYFKLAAADGNLKARARMNQPAEVYPDLAMPFHSASSLTGDVHAELLEAKISALASQYRALADSLHTCSVSTSALLSNRSCLETTRNTIEREKQVLELLIPLMNERISTLHSRRPNASAQPGKGEILQALAK